MKLQRKTDRYIMKKFSAVYRSLITIRDESRRIQLLLNYLDELNPIDRLQVIRIIAGVKSPSVLSIKKLMQWCIDYKGIPEWMLRTCHATVGDWIETLGLIIANPNTEKVTERSLIQVLKEIESVTQDKDEDELKSWLLDAWSHLSSDELYVLHKILTASLKPLVKKPALAQLLNTLHHTDTVLLLHRLRQLSSPAFTYDQLIRKEWSPDELKSKPYDFVLPEIIQYEQMHFGNKEEWIVEEFINGDRIQALSLNQEILVHHIVPEESIKLDESLRLTLLKLPQDSVIELLITRHDPPQVYMLDFHRWGSIEKADAGNILERKKMLADWLDLQQITSIALPDFKPLEQWSQNKVTADSHWMIKHVSEPHRWHLIRGKAQQVITALLYVEYINQNIAIQYNMTLGVKNADNELIPIAKISCDLLSDADKNAMHYWIQNNTVQKYGPVRVVRPGKFLRISYHRIEKNKRVKSGISLVHIRVIDVMTQGVNNTEIASLGQLTNNF